MTCCRNAPFCGTPAFQDNGGDDAVHEGGEAGAGVPEDGGRSVGVVRGEVTGFCGSRCILAAKIPARHIGA